MYTELIRMLADELEGMIGEEITTDELLMKVYMDKIADEKLISLAQYIDDTDETWIAFRLVQEAKEIGIKLDFSKYKGATLPLHHVPFAIKQGRKRNARFDNKIEEIKELCYWCGGFCDPADTIKIRFDGENVVRVKIPFDYNESFVEEMINDGFIEPQVLEISKKEFLAEFQKVNAGTWAKEYSSYGLVEDGTQWKLEITYNDGKTRKYGGSNAYPRTFDALRKLVGDEYLDEEEEGEE